MRDVIQVINYETSEGRRPFEKWFRDLDRAIQSIVLARLNRLRLGNFGDCESIAGSKIFELRVHVGRGYRLY